MERIRNIGVGVNLTRSLPELQTAAERDFATVIKGIKESPLIKPIVESWRASERGGIPVGKEIRELFQLQRTVSTLQLQVECLTKVGDSVASTVRRIQQMGGQ